MTYPLLPHDFFALPDGSRMRYGVFEPQSTPRATVFVLPGRREFIEKKHAELAQLLARGYRLIILEPRGQGLSSRFLDGPYHQRDHLTDFDQALQDIRLFYDAIVKPRVAGPLILHGHSLGGHLGLRWLAEDAPPVTACFLTAPMLAIWGHMAQLGAYGVSWVATKLFGHYTDYAPMQADYGANDRVFQDNFLSQDEELFATLDNYFTAWPAMAIGGVTWGWVLAAMHSLHIMHGRGYLQRVQTPVLALLGGDDRVTPAREVERQLKELPHHTTLVIDRARHDILSEAEIYRVQAWAAIDDFLAGFIPS